MSSVRLRVLIPGLLRSYTGGEARVDLTLGPSRMPSGSGMSPAALAPPCVETALRELDRQFPGLRFRLVDEQGAIRPHIRLFLDANQLQALDAPLPAAGELMIVGALSGG